MNFDRFAIVAPVAVEVGRARRRRQVGESHRPEGSHGPARLDAEPRAILEQWNNFEALFARQAVPHIVDRVSVFVVAAGRARAGDQPFLRAEGVGEAAAQAVEDRFQVGPEGEAPQGVVGDRATKTPVRVSPRVVQELAVVARVAALALAREARLLVLVRVTLKSIRVFGLDLWGEATSESSAP